MGKIRAVCISREKGTAKSSVGRALAIEDFGLENDAHAGKWHRQVSLLPYEEIEKFKAEGAPVTDGSFGENLITEGLKLRELPPGTRLRAGGALLEVTQIGKECHSRCAIGRAMGHCIMPEEGIFARVLTGGVIEAGDAIEIADDTSSAKEGKK